MPHNGQDVSLSPVLAPLLLHSKLEFHANLDARWQLDISLLCSLTASSQARRSPCTSHHLLVLKAASYVSDLTGLKIPWHIETVDKCLPRSERLRFTDPWPLMLEAIYCTVAWFNKMKPIVWLIEPALPSNSICCEGHRGGRCVVGCMTMSMLQLCSDERRRSACSGCACVA